ncbi:unnamed protein product [Vitrella brassicaformis CCMP3155]|uniref:Uncharacterized protein n=1 Tax=Vitrella brassicaformis (strain CCMP3155) TaxID=1169540 RepID=A0A0G4GN45_VITBC|nr:unnamed protein product [Vitrella brassicaformis CCMP3155]|eukprot:CEM31633.1 unnamed protein product [Vitrella brassicaformis CCMP3155]
MSASQPITVKFEGSEDTLTISEAVAQQYTFFQALLDGGFQEPAERTVTLKEISRPIAAVVLQTRNDMLKDITRENLLDCLSALDFLNCLQDDRPKLIDNVGRKVLRNRWHDDQDLCRAMLKMAFDRPLIRSLIGWHYDLGRACAPYLVENAKQVAAQWAVSSSDADIGIRAFIIGLLGDLKRLIDTNAGSMRLETLKRFWWTPPPHRTSTRRSSEATEDSGGASYYIRQGDVNDTSTMLLSNVRSFEMNSAYVHQSDSQRVFCFSLSVKMSIGDGGNGGDGDTITNFKAHQRDIIPFIRTVGPLGPLHMLVDHADGMMATILTSIMEDSGCDAVGEGGRPPKRRRVEV